MSHRNGQEVSPHQQMRQLVGQRFQYLGSRWTLIDILPDTNALALRRDASESRTVQTDLYGTPSRRSPDTITLPVCNADGGYSTAVTKLLNGRITG
jgi:hypothetical protein